MRDGNLFVRDLATGLESQLTADGARGRDPQRQEQLDLLGGDLEPETDRLLVESRTAGALVYYRFDERAVATYPLLDERGTYPEIRFQRYPKAGETNPTVRLRVVERRDPGDDRARDRRLARRDGGLSGARALAPRQRQDRRRAPEPRPDRARPPELRPGVGRLHDSRAPDQRDLGEHPERVPLLRRRRLPLVERRERLEPPAPPRRERRRRRHRLARGARGDRSRRGRRGGRHRDRHRLRAGRPRCGRPAGRAAEPGRRRRGT